MANVSECELGTFMWMKILPQWNLLNKKIATAISIVGTNFTNPAFPLIRYDSNDIVTFQKKNVLREAGKNR